MTRFPPHDPDPASAFGPTSDPAFDPAFDKEFLAAMTAFADDAPAPVIDAAGIRSTVRRRTLLTGAAAVAAVAAIVTGAALLVPGPTGGGDRPAGTGPAPAVQSAPAPSGPSPLPSASTSAPVSPPPVPGTAATEGTPSPAAPPASGAATVTVPSVVGLSRDAATRLLDTAGLRYEVHEFTDWKVSAGSVINSEPRAGRPAAANTTVQLFVSKGRPTG
ncbi:PASTA domain-containing protein [Kitasatospora sp. NPDC056446]|uniref:PASTA domain-containing protein n=1 Tax=Kitasatospora sp. NPDC056446 TaxID=3345819 RepID=UPI0036A185D2